MSTPGAQIQTTVKSGGNEFSGLESGAWNPADWIADNFDSELESNNASAAPVLKFYEYHIDLGGPIVRDKAWFYAAYNNFYIDTAVSGQPIELGTDVGDFDIFTAKLNYQVTERDQFIGFSTWSWKRKPNRSISATIPAESVLAQDYWIWLHKAEWQRVWSDRLYSNIMVGHMGTVWPMTPKGDPINGNEPRIEATNNLRSGAGWQPFTSKRWKPQSTGSVQLLRADRNGEPRLQVRLGLADRLAALRLELQLRGSPLPRRHERGAAPQRGPGLSRRGPEPDRRPQHARGLLRPGRLDGERPLDGDPRFPGWQPDPLLPGIGQQAGQSLPRLAALPVRTALQTSPTYLTEVFGAGATIPGDHVYSHWNVAPRMGFTYDITGEGTSVFKAYAGRYYSNIGTGLGSANPGGQASATYIFLDQNMNGVLEDSSELGERLTFAAGAGAGTPIDPNWTLAWADEASAAIEHELTADLGTRVSYVYKRMRNTWSSGLNQVLLNNRNTSISLGNAEGCAGDCPAGYSRSFNLRVIPEHLVGETDNFTMNHPGGESDMDFHTLSLALNKRFRNNFFYNVYFDYQWRSEPRSPGTSSTSWGRPGTRSPRIPPRRAGSSTTTRTSRRCRTPAPTSSRPRRATCCRTRSGSPAPTG